MPLAVDRTRLYVRGAAEALAETLWPTRCAVCDAPGEVLCDACRSALPYLDWWRACPVCGAPFGRVQCSECNPVVLGRAGRDGVPYDGCASAVTFGEAPARIVRTYKDQGERRLAEPLACLMARAHPPSWRPEAVAFVPATSAARRRRGFDHAELLARGLAQQLNLPVAAPLARPRTRDQRALSRRARLENTAGRFEALPGATVPGRLLLVDDVCTTGATLFDATDALRRAGAAHGWCLTFARVW